MTDRDKLIHKIMSLNKPTISLQTAMDIVDAIIDEGVIVPPCKVGDTVWHKEEGYLLDSYKIKFIYNDMTASNISRDLLFSVEDIGKTVFLTKEDAEEKLKELGNNAI